MTSRIVGGWLFHYQWNTPGVTERRQCDGQTRSPGRASARLTASDSARAGRPDLRRRTRLHRRAPELVAEVARSSRSLRLEREEGRLRTGGRSRVRGRRARPDRVHWFIRRRERFEDLRPGPDGIYRSEVFPGLWLDRQGAFCRRSAAVDRRSWNRAWRHPSTRPSRPNWPRHEAGGRREVTALRRPPSAGSAIARITSARSSRSGLLPEASSGRGSWPRRRGPPGSGVFERRPRRKALRPP